MWSTRDIVLFFAGAEFFHTLSHIFFAFSGMLPIHFLFITWGQQLNLIFGIIGNALITGGLLWWSKKLD